MSGHFFLLKELVRRDLQSRYVGSIFGFLWSFAQPLWQLLLFTVVFSGILRFRLAGEATDNFGIFLFCGLLPWMALQEGIQRGSTAITDNAGVVKKAQLPLSVLVIAPAISALIHELIAAAVFLPILLYHGHPDGSALGLLLLAIPAQLALTVGLALLLCSIHTFFRDTAQVVTMAMMGWFYLTPIVYSIHMVPERYRGWLELNPLTALVGLYRRALLGDGLAWVDGTWTLIALALGVLALGGWLFRRLEHTFVDQV